MNWNNTKVIVWSAFLLLWSWLLSQLIYNPLVNEQNGWFAVIPAFTFTNIVLFFILLNWVMNDWNK